jgi:L-lactate dehydrogenase complex protein LldG
VSARSEILQRVGDAVRGAPVEPVARNYRRAGELDLAGRLGRLRDRLVDYRADVHEVENVGAATTSICVAQHVRRLGVPPGLAAAWRPAGVEVVEDHGLTARQLDALDGVVTGCTLAIAETGTLVLAGGAAEGRRALTLVPDLHICVVTADQVVELVPEAFDRLGELVSRQRRPLTFVSGPSATSDIELSRVEGVHGPRRLVVLISGAGA